NKIPKLARSTGQAMGEFKKGREQVEEELKDMQESETADSTLDDEDDDLDDLETETDKETSA
ncbi:twin-arginine translocase TatA/TatE family subunit, partial [Halorubrum sp. SS7]